MFHKNTLGVSDPKQWTFLAHFAQVQPLTDDIVIVVDSNTLVPQKIKLKRTPLV